MLHPVRRSGRGGCRQATGQARNGSSPSASSLTPAAQHRRGKRHKARKGNVCRGANVRYRWPRFLNLSKSEGWFAPSCCSLEREEREVAQIARKPTDFAPLSTDQSPKAQQKMHHSGFRRLGA
ncbi:RRXRR domain-containing protein [Paraburkholderia oxyphila]|uniref:RRXRR domain-containing protein n=1 Tax=Paraburkholderia oxyphila TaxID=614212 RepID=UPI0012EE5F5A